MPNPKLETYKNKATNTVYDLTDADAQGKLTAILDGTSIDSFGDVESALNDKTDLSVVASEFDTEYIYSVGACVIYQGKLYTFKVKHLAGAWNSAEVVETDVYQQITNKQDHTDFDGTDFSVSETVSLLDGHRIESVALNKSTTPTNGDTKPITSDAVYDALTEKLSWTDNGVLGAKNINGTKYVAKTQHGIEWTVNSDGSLIADGETGGTLASIADESQYGFIAPFTGMVKLLGGYNANIVVFPYDWTSSARPYTNSSKTTRVSDDQFGNDPLYFYMEEGHNYSIIARVKTNTEADNIALKPLLTLASDTDTTYQPYAMTNQELTFKREATSVSGIDIIYNNQECIIDFNGVNLGSVTSTFTTVVSLAKKPKHALLMSMVGSLSLPTVPLLFYLGTSGTLQVATQDGQTYTYSTVSGQMRFTLI